MARRERLNREKVLAAALDLADREGLDGLSMRRLAKELGVEAMALYNHVSNKTDILDGVAEQVLAGVERPDPALPWDQRLRATVLAMYRAFARHPVVPLALVSDQANPTSLRALEPLEDMLGALYESGLDDVAVRRTVTAVNSLVFGSLLLSTTGFVRPPTRGSGQQDVDAYVRHVDPDRLPHFSRLLATLPDLDAEADFVRALDVLVAGLTT